MSSLFNEIEFGLSAVAVGGRGRAISIDILALEEETVVIMCIELGGSCFVPFICHDLFYVTICDSRMLTTAFFPVMK